MEGDFVESIRNFKSKKVLIEALENNYKIQEKHHKAYEEVWREYEQLDSQKV